MSLPLTEQPSLVDQTRTAVGRRLRVLVVDGDEALCRALASFLKEGGMCEVRAVANAKAAILEIDGQEAPFECVFIDLQMPGTSGVDLCRIIRNTTGYEDVPVVMLATEDGREHLHTAVINGASAFLLKPFDFNEIRTLLGRERVKSRIRTRQKSDAEVQRSSVLSQREGFDLSVDDPVCIHGVTRGVTKDALESYVQQAASQFAVPLVARAFKIPNVFGLYSQLPDGAYPSLLQDVAETISRNTRHRKDVFAHYGNGGFISVNAMAGHHVPTSTAEVIETRIQLSTHTGRDGHLNLIVGRDVALQGDTHADVLFALKQTVESAEELETVSFPWNSYEERRSLRKSLGRVQTRIKTSAYQSVLYDLVDEKGAPRRELPTTAAISTNNDAKWFRRAIKTLGRVRRSNSGQ